ETNYVASNGSAQLKVNKATPAFSALAGPTIVYGGTPTALSGTIQAGSLVPPGNVSITVNGVTQSVSINSSTGNFSSSFTTGSLGVAGSPYTIVPALVDPNSKLGNYSVTIKNGTLTINNATPVITWSNPAGITYGTALNGGQLNPTANVGGTFTYTPASGTVLGAGNNQNLRADFVPSD